MAHYPHERDYVWDGARPHRQTCPPGWMEDYEVDFLQPQARGGDAEMTPLHRYPTITERGVITDEMMQHGGSRTYGSRYESMPHQSHMLLDAIQQLCEDNMRLQQTVLDMRQQIDRLQVKGVPPPLQPLEPPQALSVQAATSTQVFPQQSQLTEPDDEFWPPPPPPVTFIEEYSQPAHIIAELKECLSKLEVHKSSTPQYTKSCGSVNDAQPQVNDPETAPVNQQQRTELHITAVTPRRQYLISPIMTLGNLRGFASP
ncbi:hypothetical protein LDENG_00150770 [Lucifuga dentata]|nr:hypothetical protein LDENG_00150770 [Lucifuga dentata]